MTVVVRHQSVKPGQRPSTRSRGFTLLELLIVVSILAALSGIGVSVVGNYFRSAHAEMVDVEMERIANAVLKFNADTGYFPGEGPFARTTWRQDDAFDFAFLFYAPGNDRAGHAVGTRARTDVGLERRWSGPYLSASSMRYLRIDQCRGPRAQEALEVFPLNVPQRRYANGIIALQDPFEKPQNAVGRGDRSAPCFVTRTTTEDQPRWINQSRAGQPYRYDPAFRSSRYLECPKTGRGCVALLSAGPNGRFENGDADDVVKILRFGS
ncbi:MAG: prepilin-type N-terminal cleavage/methylation domain-containing protein [Pseudomonadota bacterium]